MTKKPYVIGIIGGGAVGLTYAALLSEVASVMVKTKREAQAKAIAADGISFEDRKSNAEVFKNVQATINYSALKDCDAIIVAVKSYDTEAIVRDLNKIIQPRTTVLTLQNGLQALDILHKQLDHPERVFTGVTYVGAQRTDDRSVVNGTNFRTIIDADAGKLTEIFKNSRLDTEISDHIKQAVWDKLALNVGQNALSAVTNLNFSQMLASADCLEIASHLLAEFEQVAKAENLNFDEPLMGKLRANWEGSSFYPSMWQDLYKGRRTEIDAINGALSQLGRKHSIATPYNDMITSMVKALETNDR